MYQFNRYSQAATLQTKNFKAATSCNESQAEVQAKEGQKCQN